MLKSAKERDAHNRMFEKAIKEFGEIVLKEPAIIGQLEATRNANEFISTYCKLAADRGINFSHEDMKIVVQEQKTGSDWVLPKVVMNIVREIF